MAMKHVTDLQVCLAVALFRAREMNGPWPYEILAEVTGQPEKVCYRAMERACKRDLIEYGVSLRTGWLTEKGRELVWTA